MIKNVLYLMIAAVIATVAISIVEQSTRDRRATNSVLYATRMLSEVLPDNDYDQPPGLRVLQLVDAELLGGDGPQPAYPVYRDGQMVAIVLSVVARDGYVGPIPLLVGVSRDGEVLGVRATDHRETPGLGDKIEPQKSSWILQFDQTSLETVEVWKLRTDGGEFDHITGATITSRAVTHAVNRALQYFATHRDFLTGPPAD